MTAANMKIVARAQTMTRRLFWTLFIRPHPVAGYLGACLTHDRRSEGASHRAAFCDRYPRIAGAYVRETIAERCR